MAAGPIKGAQRLARRLLRQALAGLPAPMRHAVYRYMVDADPHPDAQLTFKIAETQEELSACFALLHDAYVGEGYMKPQPSGLRVTIYHALPTTTTLCACWDGEVVGTVSLVREGVFGLPLQSAFDLTDVRAREGQIAEVSALAVARQFRKTGGAILFPLLKFMYEYTTNFFDTRHLVIAVHPTRIDLYEALLMFERLRAAQVDEYDFANGAPAIGATLDLQAAPTLFRRVYAGRPPRRDLLTYFTETRLPNIQLPQRRFNVTNDPVMTPVLLDEFFNRRTQVFKSLDARKVSLLHNIYNRADFRAVLPAVPAAVPGRAGSGAVVAGGVGVAGAAGGTGAPGSEAGAGGTGAAQEGLGGAPSGHRLRRHERYSLKCKASIRPPEGEVGAATVIELSLHGFQARCDLPLPVGTECDAEVELGKGLTSTAKVRVMREVPATSGRFYGFLVENPDRLWRQCVQALQQGLTGADLMRVQLGA